jgi:hypothetical protein
LILHALLCFDSYLELFEWLLLPVLNYAVFVRITCILLLAAVSVKVLKSSLQFTFSTFHLWAYRVHFRKYINTYFCIIMFYMVLIPCLNRRSSQMIACLHFAKILCSLQVFTCGPSLWSATPYSFSFLYVWDSLLSFIIRRVTDSCTCLWSFSWQRSVMVLK